MANYLHALYHEAGLRNEVPDEKWCPSVQMVVDIRTLKLPGPPPIVQGEDKNHSPADPQRPGRLPSDQHAHRPGRDTPQRLGKRSLPHRPTMGGKAQAGMTQRRGRAFARVPLQRWRLCDPSHNASLKPLTPAGSGRSRLNRLYSLYNSNYMNNGKI